MTIPKDLLDAFDNSEVVGVIGSGLSVAAGFPSWNSLLLLMVEECERNVANFDEANELRQMLQEGLLFEVADECRTRLGNSLYRDFLQRTFLLQGVQPTPHHRLLVQLPFQALVTTNYDTLLEHAYTDESGDAGLPPVYTQNNVAQLAQLVSQKRFFILKLHGHINDIETIILTARDYQTLLHRTPAYRSALSTLIATKTLLFVGYGMRDPDLTLILSENQSVFQGYGRRHYAIMADARNVITRSLKDRFNISVLSYDSADNHAALQPFLVSLKKSIGSRSCAAVSQSRRLSDQPLPRFPYKFLDHYEIQDRDLFFGREDEGAALLELIPAHRLVVLFGRSGVGKTSFLKGSLLPSFADRGYACAYCQLTTPTLETVLDELRDSLDITGEVPADNSANAARTIVNHLRRLGKPGLIVLDQCEQLFLNQATKEADVGEFIAALIGSSRIECHVILAIREEYFAGLNNLSVQIPEVFQNRFHLTLLSLDGARRAIVNPAQRVGVSCEPTYVEAVLSDIGQQGVVEPAQLQIICTAMYRAMSPEQRVMTLDLYRNLGGAQTLLADYIGHVLGSFRETDREIARSILKCLVGAGEERRRLTRESVMLECSGRYPEGSVKAVLETLVYQRLLRVSSEREGALYELPHDYMLPYVDRWISDEERGVKRIREVLQHERSICAHLNTLIPLETARFMHLYSEKAEFNSSDMELIERSIKAGEVEQEERRQLETQLRQSQKMEAVGRLAGGIAHDFNNLLSVIVGYTELLLKRLESTDPLYREIEQINRAAKQGASLTRQLVAFGRKQVLEPKVLDLNALVTETDKLVKRLIGEDVEAITVLDPKLGSVRADSGQLEQVIMNLVVNARDAMPQGGKLTIRTANVALDDIYARSHAGVRPGLYVMLGVSDTGTGMDADTQAHIFEPFFTTKEPGKGTGLGLSTCYGIIRQSGGHIRVISELGKGSTFEVLFPTVLDAISTDRIEGEISITAQGTALVVDDEESIRQVATSMLHALGFTCVEASNGKEAVQRFREATNPFDLVLMDLIMPQLSGPEAAKQILAIDGNAKIILMSGYSVDRGELWKEVCIGFLNKPFTPTDLLRAVQKV
ncbi:MAG: SIR2 family protein [Acidobacteria bacterium]|nr:SIR2 family protein [Acidobacteriota bacterium]